MTNWINNITFYIFIIFAYNILALILLTFASYLISTLLITISIFINMCFLLFILQLELIPLLILLVSIGALLILILFSLFVVNQFNISNTKLLNNYFYFMVYIILIIKIIIFFSNMKFNSFTQLNFWNQNFEFTIDGMGALYSLNIDNGYGIILVAIGILFMLLTVIMSLLFQNYLDDK